LLSLNLILCVFDSQGEGVLQSYADHQAADRNTHELNAVLTGEDQKGVVTQQPAATASGTTE
jgi:hypothetical protein